jgi:predicted Zn-dependent protease with MMP-like domain
LKREHLVRLVEEVLDGLPMKFRERIHNLAVIVEDRPKMRKKTRGLGRKIGAHKPRSLLMEVFQGMPATHKSVFDLCLGPNRIVLYPKNIEVVCRNHAEIRHEVRQTVLHELGHYFGMDESQLKDV